MKSKIARTCWIKEKISVQKHFSTSCKTNSAIGNFRKRLCFCFIAMEISIYDMLFNFQESRNNIMKLISIFSFQLKKIFWEYPIFIGENPGTNQNFMAHVL